MGRYEINENLSALKLQMCLRTTSIRIRRAEKNALFILNKLSSINSISG